MCGYTRGNPNRRSKIASFVVSSVVIKLPVVTAPPSLSRVVMREISWKRLSKLRDSDDLDPMVKISITTMRITGCGSAGWITKPRELPGVLRDVEGQTEHFPGLTYGELT